MQVCGASGQHGRRLTEGESRNAAEERRDRNTNQMTGRPPAPSVLRLCLLARGVDPIRLPGPSQR